ncbi:hypothetical protein [Henriciella sp.]|uniref:hypothetical protein n=1 Tax=Henriciella sp. TaxID=1968823 RepID=UPI002630A096|nr:hypothetical protein [Henriciella sp.]
MRLPRLAALRLLLLCLGAFGYTVNGAQAHIYVPGSETVEVQLCGLHGDRTVTMTFGADQPAQLGDDSCCGPCLASAIVSVPVFQVVRPGVPQAEPVIPPRGQQPVLTYSIWPGAPPNGPPHTLEG